jgi:hypothetical protein
MTYLTVVTNWLNTWGPMAWGVAFFVGAYAAVGIYWAVTVVSKRRIINQYADRASRKTDANPLATSFREQSIDLTTFFSPYYIPHKSKRFIHCHIYGPVMALFRGSAIYTGVTFKFCQIMIIRPNVNFWGAVVLEDCILDGGSLCDVTLLMNKETYERMPADVKEHIPVISEATAPPRPVEGIAMSTQSYQGYPSRGNA